MNVLTLNNNALHFSKLYTVVCSEYGSQLNPEYTYAIACDGLIRTLSAYEQQHIGQVQFTLIGHVDNGVQEYLLTYQMAKIYVDGLDRPDVSQKLSIMLDYAYNPTAFRSIVAALPVESNIQLTSEGESPVFSDGRRGLSSLQIAEIASNAKGTTVRHADILRAIKRLMNSHCAGKRRENLCYETVESTYLNTRNQEQRFNWLSYDLALLVAGTYSPAVQSAVIAETVYKVVDETVTKSWLKDFISNLSMAAFRTSMSTIPSPCKSAIPTGG